MKRVRIAQAEGRDWRSELDKFLIMYGSIVHTIMGVSRSELLFGRKIGTKLPKVIDYNVDDIAVSDRDAEMQEKAGLYADTRRGAKDSDIHSGDKVLIKQDRKNKMSTRFNPSPFKVVE